MRICVPMLLHAHMQSSLIACATIYRLRIKLVNRITMEDLAQHLKGGLNEWPATQLQALEIILNSPFINNPSLLYITRTLFPANQVCCQSGPGRCASRQCR